MTKRSGSVADRLHRLGVFDDPEGHLRNTVTGYLRDGVAPKHLLVDDYERGPHRENKYILTESPDADRFVLNLILLHDFFGVPKTVKGILRGELEPNEARRLVEARLSELWPRHKLYQFWMKHGHDLAGLLAVADLDLAKIDLHRRLLGERQDEAVRVPDFLAATARRMPDIHTVRLEERIEEQSVFSENDVGDMAKKALYRLRLGEIDLAEDLVDHALDTEPTNIEACRVKASVLVHRSRSNTQQAGHYQMLAGEMDAGSSAEQHYEQLAAEHAGYSLEERLRALPVLLTALRHWPTENREGKDEHQDRRGRMATIILTMQIAFDQAHDHGSVTISGDGPTIYEKLACRREGRPLDAYFDAETDALLLDIIREEEQTYWHDFMRLHISSMQWELTRLQLYFALDPAEYERCGAIWLEYLESADPDNVLRYLSAGDAENSVLIEHLDRLMPDPERAQFLDRLRERFIQHVNERVDAVPALIDRWHRRFDYDPSED